MTRRARSRSVMAILAAGALLLIAGTQTWLTVTLTTGGSEPLEVSGTGADRLLMPLSLAALAAGLLLSISGRVLRYVLGAIALAVAVILGVTAVNTAFIDPRSASASAVTEATGLTGSGVSDALIDQISVSAWPFVTVAAAALLALAALFVLGTASKWAAVTSRYDAAKARTAGEPRDAVESWDDLSRGEDPTA